MVDVILSLLLCVGVAVVHTVWPLQSVQVVVEDGEDLVKVRSVRGVVLPAVLHQVVAVGREGGGRGGR